MNSSTIKTLVLYAQKTDKFSYYDDWKDAFIAFPGFETICMNIYNKANIRILTKSIREYDLIVLLHSTNSMTLTYLNQYKNVLSERRAKLLTFVGNEVNLPGSAMRAKIDFIRDIEADFIGTQLLLEAGEWLFEECKKSKVVSLPHALNPEIFKPVISQEKRHIDIGVRSAKYLPHLGDNERSELFSFFQNHHFDPPIISDIDTQSRFTRDEWAAFLNNCKATIANEAGSYYLERDDKTVQAIRQYINTKQKMNGMGLIGSESRLIEEWRVFIPEKIRQVLRLPLKKALSLIGINYETDLSENVDFDEIFERFYMNYKKPPAYTKGISSRHFDAIGTKTCQIMFKGRYNDILTCDENYIAVDRDFSNIDDVMERFRDLPYRQAMIDRTYDFVMNKHTYSHRISYIKDLIENS